MWSSLTSQNGQRGRMFKSPFYMIPLLCSLSTSLIVGGLFTFAGPVWAWAATIPLGFAAGHVAQDKMLRLRVSFTFSEAQKEIQIAKQSIEENNPIAARNTLDGLSRMFKEEEEGVG